MNIVNYDDTIKRKSMSQLSFSYAILMILILLIRRQNRIRGLEGI